MSELAQILAGSFQRAPWGWGLLATVLIALIKGWPVIARVNNERESNLLEERAEDMASMRAEIAELKVRMDVKDKLHEAERAYDRHRINNLATSLRSFFLLVKRHPEDAAAAAAEIEKMRAEQIEEENKEAIALRKLEVALTTGKVLDE